MEAVELVETEEVTEYAEGIELLESFFEPVESIVEGTSQFVPLPNIAHLIDEDTLPKSAMLLLTVMMLTGTRWMSGLTTLMSVVTWLNKRKSHAQLRGMVLLTSSHLH